jgi:hypothetical protein
MDPYRRMRSFLTLRGLGCFTLLALAAGCGEKQATSTAVPPASSQAASPVEVAQVHGPTAGLGDAGAQQAQGAPSDAGPYDGPRIAALFLMTPVMSDMEWPAKDGDRRRGRAERDPEISKSVIVGYLRQGARVPVIPEAHPKKNCEEGWYELLAGGFVCGKYATLDFNHPRVKIAPHEPNMDGPLPYDYGVNLRNGTPLYRTVPSREERLKLEPWLVAKPKPKPEDPAPATPQLTDNDPTLTGDAGATLAVSTTTLTSVSDPFGLAAAADDAGVPWYLREYDGGKPTAITLDELHEDGGPISRRMVKGFYVALDKEWRDPHGIRWWRTTGGMLAPYERIYVTKPPTAFHGLWIRDDAPVPPSTTGDAGPNTIIDSGVASAPRKPVQDPAAFGFILWVHAHKWHVGEDRKKATQSESVPRFTAARLTGETAQIAGYTYEETDEGWWMRTNEGTRTMPGPAPSDLKPGEKWIDVNLTTQTLVAYEGEKPVYVTLVSTGKRDLEVKEKDHPTPKGTYRLREKHIAATMDGDVASDGPYSIEDVPWIMYFSGSYALHGAFWHSNFGHTKSHGCVNLSPEDARQMFGWTEPRLPDTWHGVVATDEKPGTRVVVHD